MLRTHLLPRYGSRLVGAISVEDVETLLVDLRHQGLGPVRANKIRALLSRLLERAMRNKLRADNPVLDVRAGRGKKAEVDPLSFAEVRRLFEVGLAGDEESRRLYTVKIFTGLRTSELLGLQWDDVDLKAAAPVASIRRSVTKADGVHGVKTEGSERTIDLRPQVVAALKAQRAASQLRSDYVFPSAVGGPRDRDNLAARVWRPALKRASLRMRKEYQTRHTFATLALGAGESISWVSSQLGHVSTGMVVKHYNRFIPNLTRRDGSALDKAAAEAGL
jgi:integrase